MAPRSVRTLLALVAVLLAACGPTVTPGGPAISLPPTAVISGTLPPQPSPLPTASGTTVIAAVERDAWARIRATLPQGTPVAAPTWLPAVLDRDRPTVTGLRAESTDPQYVVTYSGGGRAIELGMGGPGPAPGQSGLGTRVRRSNAVLSFPPILFSDPSAPETRLVRWQEAGRTLWIGSSTFPGGDLLRIAWELDLTSAPAAQYRRVRDGACASMARPEDTIDRLLALIGSRDQDAVLDCFALDVGFANWATLPTTTDRVTRRLGDVGGRVYVQGSWTFTSEPAFWTQGSKGNQLFQLGVDGGRWRVFEVGTGGYGSPP